MLKVTGQRRSRLFRYDPYLRLFDEPEDTAEAPAAPEATRRSTCLRAGPIRQTILTSLVPSDFPGASASACPVAETSFGDRTTGRGRWAPGHVDGVLLQRGERDDLERPLVGWRPARRRRRRPPRGRVASSPP